VTSTSSALRHIFPGGYMASLAETPILIERCGLDVRAIENRSYHDRRTVNRWLRNFEEQCERIHAIDPGGGHRGPTGRHCDLSTHRSAPGAHTVPV